MRWLYAFILLNLCLKASAQDTVYLSSELYIVQLSKSAYVHVSFHTDPKWGRFSSNGMVYVDMEKGHAYLFDTPMDDSLTKALVNWIKNKQHWKLKMFCPNHFHEDCTTELNLNEGSEMITLLHAKTAQLLAIDSTNIDFQCFTSHYNHLKHFEVYYLGEAHTSDNIVVWFPKENILFGGCMVKSMQSKSLGNTTDANLEAWPKTIQKVKSKFKEAELVIPGHGPWGTSQLLDHTLKLLKE